MGEKDPHKIAHLYAAMEYVEDNALAVDVGAHHGIYSLLMAGRFCEVVSFEPCTEARKILKKNTACVDNVAINGSAVSDVTGSGTCLWRKAKVTGDNTQGCYIGRTGEVLVEDDVRTVRLSDVFYGEQTVTFLKIDVEGTELQVLRGAKRQIVQDRPVIMIEMVDRYLRTRGGTSAEALHQYVTERGYERVKVMDEDHIYVPSAG